MFYSGVGLCLFSGILYGQLFTPATYIQDNEKDASQNGRFITGTVREHMSCIMRRSDFCICKNKGTYHLRSNRAAGQCLCFSLHSTIPLLPISGFLVSGHLLWLYSPVCSRTGRKPQRQVLS